MALGAPRRSVLGLALRFGLGLTALGILIGVGAAMVATRFMSHMIYGVQTTDPLTFVISILCLTGIAFLAC